MTIFSLSTCTNVPSVYAPVGFLGSTPCEKCTTSCHVALIAEGMTPFFFASYKSEMTFLFLLFTDFSNTISDSIMLSIGRRRPRYGFVSFSEYERVICVFLADERMPVA